MKPTVISDLPRDIGPLWSHAPRAVRGEIVLAPATYSWLSYNLGGGASDNWDEVFVALDLLNFLRSQPTFENGSGRLAAFLEAAISNRRFMQKEFGSWVYLEMHAGPRIVQFGCARILGQHDARWATIAQGLRGWLRALVGWLAVFGCWGPGRRWGVQVATECPGAKLLVGKGAVSVRTGEIPWSTLTGKRSWDCKSGEWRENVFAPSFLWTLGLGHRDGRGDILRAVLDLIQAVESHLGGPLVVLTAEEEARVLAATRNDVSALQWCVAKLIGDWLPAEPIVGVRTARGVSCTMLSSGKSATATMQHCGWLDDGTTYAAGADNGLRGAHGEQIEETMAAVDLDARTGYCQRTSGPDRVRVDFPLPPGELVSVIEAQHGVGLKARWFEAGREIVPPPLPSADHGGEDPTRPATQRKERRFF